MDFFRRLLINLGINALFLWIYLPFFRDPIDFWAPANIIFMIVDRSRRRLLFYFEGTDRLGASISACLTNATPLFATLFAVLFLEDSASVTNFLGSCFIVAGIIFLSWRGATKTWTQKIFYFHSRRHFSSHSEIT